MSPPARPLPHLAPACCALAVAALLLMGVRAYVDPRLPGDLPHYAAHPMSFKVNGNVLQTLAFRTPHELPVYGSSELDMAIRHRPDDFFLRRPTGFAVFPVGRGGSTCLMILQKLAAVGDAARGKEVVIFLSPTWFLDPTVDPDAVEANLGITQLSAWIFNGNLSQGLETDIARRLQDYSGKLKNQTLLREAVRCLARPTPLNRLRFALLSPAGKAQRLMLARLDYCVLLWEMVFPQRRWSVRRPEEPAPPRLAGGGIDWDRVVAQAEGDARAQGPTMEYTHEAAAPSQPGSHDQDFTAELQASEEFGDLALLVRVLEELRMKACFISQPFNGIYSDSIGVTPQVRRAYYDRLQAVVRPSGYPLRDFSEHEEDPFFFSDEGHPSAKAWIYYDREIDRFHTESGR